MTDVGTLLLTWLVVYVLPAAAALVFAFYGPVRKSSGDEWIKQSTIGIHVALLFSIAMSQYAIHAFGLVFPWQPNTLSVVVLVSSIALATVLLGVFGLVYALSAFVQEATMLSVAYLLFPIFPLWLVILLIMPMFSICHLLSRDGWKLRLLLVTIWGSASILIFYLTYNIYLVIALHTALGALLSRTVMLTWLKHR